MASDTSSGSGPRMLTHAPVASLATRLSQALFGVVYLCSRQWSAPTLLAQGSALLQFLQMLAFPTTALVQAHRRRHEGRDEGLTIMPEASDALNLVSSSIAAVANAQVILALALVALAWVATYLLLAATTSYNFM